MGELSGARDRLAEMVRSAPNDKLAERFQEDLQRFDQAMAALREEVERRRRRKVQQVMALVPGAVTGKAVVSKRADFHEPPKEKPVDPFAPVKEKPVDPFAPVKETPAPEPAEAPAGDAVDDDEEEEVRSPGKGRFVLYLLLFLAIVGAGGGWLYKRHLEDKENRRVQEVMLLERIGAKLLTERRWEEASKVYEKIALLAPKSEVVRLGRQSIEAGMLEEKEQFIGYWTGEATNAFNAGRLDDAKMAVAKLMELEPNDPAARELSRKIESARVGFLREKWRTKVREAIEARKWDDAEKGVVELANELPGDPLISALAKEIVSAREKERQDLKRARELAAAAKLRDTGNFDEQALQWMRDALALAPHDEEIRALYEKIASYSRTIRVPGDAATLEAALADARDRDRVVLGEGVFPAGMALNAAVMLEGAGEGKTVLEAEAESSPVLTFGPGAEGAEISGVVFRQTGFDPSEKRFPAVQVRGAKVQLSDCEFRDASGSGLEVIDGGTVHAVRCVTENNGWNGMTARGKGSRLVVEKSRAIANFGHGFEIWDGAAASLRECEARNNSRNGILIDAASDGMELAGNRVSGNREYGILLSAGAAGEVTGNRCEKNRLGGLLVRFAAMSVQVRENEIVNNGGGGLILEQGLQRDLYGDNSVRSNDGRDVRAGVRFNEGD